jgi:putative oligomerization/nucleic acid binding protein
VKTDHISWLLYFVGSLLVFGSWVDLVPTGLGWTGWLMALVGWAIGNRHSRSENGHTPLLKAEEIEKLDHLRQRNVISEEEFQREKQRLLDQPT